MKISSTFIKKYNFISYISKDVFTLPLPITDSKSSRNVTQRWCEGNNNEWFQFLRCVARSLAETNK